MECHAFSMGTSGNLSAPELGFEGSNSISSEISSSRRDHGDRVEGTTRAQKKRKVRTKWSNKQTEQLLRAYQERMRMDKIGRSCMCSIDWQSISESVDGKAGIDCQRRMDTLTKSFNKIKIKCAAPNKQFSELTEEEKRSLNLPTKMETNWLIKMCKIKGQPQNAMVAPSPGSAGQSISSSLAPVAVMAGPDVDTIGEVVGTPVPAWLEQDPPRSTSPTDLQSHCSAAPGHPTLADPPHHSHHSMNGDEAWIETVLSSPRHVPTDDLESSHIYEGLDDFEHLDDLSRSC